MLAAVILALRGLKDISIGSLVRIGLVAVAGFLIVIFVIHAWNARYRAGWNDALNLVAKQNAAAAAVANKVRVTVDQCFDKGGDWDVTRGTCNLPAN